MKKRFLWFPLMVCFLGVRSVLSHIPNKQESFNFANSPLLSDPDRSQIHQLMKQEKMDINRCTIAELELLPSIGPTLAKRIIDFRNKHGSFKSLQNLQQVKGIGDKTIANLSKYLTI